MRMVVAGSPAPGSSIQSRLVESDWIDCFKKRSFMNGFKSENSTCIVQGSADKW